MSNGSIMLSLVLFYIQKTLNTQIHGCFFINHENYFSLFSQPQKKLWMTFVRVNIDAPRGDRANINVWYRVMARESFQYQIMSTEIGKYSQSVLGRAVVFYVVLGSSVASCVGILMIERVCACKRLCSSVVRSTADLRTSK